MTAVRRLAVLACLLPLAAAAGCSSSGDAAPDGAALRVVATTTQLADFARQVGGERAAVTTILSAEADPHDYEPRPSDARAVAEADVVLQSGGDLDAWLDDVVEGAGGDAGRLTLKDAVGARGEDPHWWQDPRNVVRAVERIRAAFGEADPAGRGAFEAAARRYVRDVRVLDAAVERCFAAIPERRRALVTTHDAFGWFAGRYGIDVLGAITPALSTAARPSAGDVRELVAAIRRRGVRTIFPEASLGRRLERAVAEEAGARVGPPLYADTLGPEGSPGATYLGALRHDAAAIAEGFGGSCDLPSA